MTPQFVPDKMVFAIAGVMAVASAPAGRALEWLFVDGVELLPEPSLQIRNHSPSGFAWGYTGSGAAQTALAICLHIFGNAAVAGAIYQDFKAEFVSKWPLAKPFNQQIDITDFLLDHWQEVSDAYCSTQHQVYG